jgi:hypothetical protein
MAAIMGILWVINKKWGSSMNIGDLLATSAAIGEEAIPLPMTAERLRFKKLRTIQDVVDLLQPLWKTP